jgi:hypothetical protein
MRKFRPVDSPPVNEQGSHCAEWLLKPYFMVELVILGFESFQFPRNLDETRCGFVYGEEDGVKGVGTGCFDLEAVLFVRSPVL